MAKPSDRRVRPNTGPTPGRMETGRGASSALASAAPMTEKPRGLSISEAILARKRLGARPMETVRPVSSSIHFCRRIS
ncbi:hypothetical protein D3C73_1254580 [compost metagenome]